MFFTRFIRRIFHARTKTRPALRRNDRLSQTRTNSARVLTFPAPGSTCVIKFAARLSLFLIVAAGSLFAQNPLERIDNLRLLEDGALDADSIHVTDGETNYHLRL